MSTRVQIVWDVLKWLWREDWKRADASESACPREARSGLLPAEGEPGTKSPTIAWKILDNPIYANDSVTIKDGELVVRRGSWWRRWLRV